MIFAAAPVIRVSTMVTCATTSAADHAPSTRRRSPVPGGNLARGGFEFFSCPAKFFEQGPEVHHPISLSYKSAPPACSKAWARCSTRSSPKAGP